MQRPEVRVIETQSEQTIPIDLEQSEVEKLLAKYGHKSQYNKSFDNDPNQNLTFDEMIIRQEQKEKDERSRMQQLRNGAKPVSFNNEDLGYSETKYTDIDIDDQNKFGIKIQIVSDMKLPK